jgi:hypothetical protein
MLSPTPIRTTEFAPALPPQSDQAATRQASTAPASGYGPPTAATRLGKRVASPGKTFLSSPMGRSVAQQGRNFVPMNIAEKLTGVCAWCTQPVSAVAVLVRGVCLANGKAAPPRSRVRKVACCIPSLWASLLSSGGIGVGDSIDTLVCNWYVLNTSR